MSGIGGVYHPDGRPVKPECLQRMLEVLAHRGPDGAQIWCQGSV